MRGPDSNRRPPAYEAGELPTALPRTTILAPVRRHPREVQQRRPVPVELVKIIIDENNNDQAIVLREKGGVRQVPIVIGFVEASSIQMKISGVVTPRPLTHDLLSSVIRALEAEVQYLLIDDLIATGGTALAGIRLLERAGAKVIGCSFVIDLPEIGGAEKLRALGMNVTSLVAFEGH